MKAPICTDCNTEMQPGFMPELTPGGAYVQARWHPGRAKSETVFGIKTGAVKVEASIAVPIIAFRCASCCQLKFVAPNGPTRLRKRR